MKCKRRRRVGQKPRPALDQKAPGIAITESLWPEATPTLYPLSIRFYPSSSNRVPAPYAASTDHTEQQQEESVRFSERPARGAPQSEGVPPSTDLQQIFLLFSFLCFCSTQYFSDAHLLFRSFLSPLIHSCPQVPQSTGSQSWPNRSSIYTNCTSWSWNAEDWSK